MPALDCQTRIIDLPVSLSQPNSTDWVMFTQPDGSTVIRAWGTAFPAIPPVDKEFQVVLGSGGVAISGSTYQSDDIISRKVRVFRGGIKQGVINVTGYYYAFNGTTGTITFTPNLLNNELLQIEID